jgi:hypothetical protein
MGTVLAVARIVALLPTAARKSHRVVGCLLMAAGALIAFLAWLSGARMELRS